MGQRHPVLLAPTLAERVGAEQPPCLEETRRYVRPDGRRSRVVVGENNVGLVSVARVTAWSSTGY